MPRKYRHQTISQTLNASHQVVPGADTSSTGLQSTGFPDTEARRVPGRFQLPKLSAHENRLLRRTGLGESRHSETAQPGNRRLALDHKPSSDQVMLDIIRQ